MKLYHGSIAVVDKPELGKGNHRNDYGLGLYCTEHLELAKEWACAAGRDGFANEYELDLDGLTVCDLTGLHILNWIAVLLENRTFDLSAGVASSAREYILENFLPDYKSYDVVRGYRADDSYFSFAKEFLNNSLSIEDLGRAMRLGELGEQVVLKSERAFAAVVFKEAVQVDCSVYYPRWRSRDQKARDDYQKIKTRPRAWDGTFIVDIMRQQWRNDDERLQ